MPEDDAWDWPLLLYVGTVVLKRSEAAFWRMSPRKLNALVAAHIEINNPDSDNQPKKNNASVPVGFIDNIIP